MSTESLHLGLFLFGLLSTVMSFATWVLAAINIRRNTAFNSDYNKIDPATLVFGVLANLFFLGLICLGNRPLFKAKNTLLYIGALLCWVFALAVSYCVRRWEAPNNCPDSGVFPEGCRGRFKALIAFTWVDFILFSFYAICAALLARKHQTLPWTNREIGWNVPVDSLCPPQSALQVAEEKAANKNGGAANAV
ncbi:hypothetical protein BDY24DRAFT_382082 [Mrakia frigida]|uniref:uncharacterized protein n=1 Tax=Mrakia frigida TaxID=29902 RepID=UPI003FCBF181